MALFMMTADKAANPNTLINNGSRNSAPPRPIIPPSTPTAAPAAKAGGSGRAARADTLSSFGAMGNHAPLHLALAPYSRPGPTTPREAGGCVSPIMRQLSEYTMIGETCLM
ncbi:hypothetical protein GCM10023259_049650 [Thermocatellispora tengchongensis]